MVPPMASRAAAFGRALALIFGATAAVHAQSGESALPQFDPQSLPIVPIAQALEDRNGDTIPDRLLQPIRVRGVVTIGTGVMTDDRVQVYIQDDTGGIFIFSRRPHPPKIAPGDMLEVAGIVDQYRAGVQIVMPRYEIVGRAPIPRPLRMSLKEAASFRYYGRLVEVEGKLGAPLAEGPNTSIPLTGDDGSIKLLLPPAVNREFPFATMPEGTRVKVAGVVSIYSLVRPYREGFRLIIDSPSAVHVLSRPMPAWVRRAAVLVIIALLAGGVALAVVRMLQKRAKRRERYIAVLNALPGSLAGSVSDVDTLLSNAVAIMSRHQLIGGAVVHMVKDNQLRMHGAFGIDHERARLVDERLQSRIGPKFTLEGDSEDAGAIVVRDSAANLHPFLCVPLQGRSRTIGILTAFTTVRHTLAPDEASTIAAAANLIALGIENIQVLHEAEQRQEELKQLAITDPLTGLYNRRFLDEYLRIHIPMAKRQSAPVSFIAIDLDRFKSVNDTCGHEAGDKLLAEIGKTIRRLTRASDLPARVGGEEFLVVMPDTNEAGAVVFAERLQKELRDTDVSALGMPQGFAVTASIGVGIYPDHGEDVSHLLRVVDEALYASKNAGRDRITVAPAPFRVDTAE